MTDPECTIPPIPAARGFEASGTGTIVPRYEDVTQDGRVQLTALIPGLGAVWRALAKATMLDALRAGGILPIMQRLIVRGERGPFSALTPIECSGTWRLARQTGGDRLFLDVWIEARAPHGTTHAPPSPDAERVLVGRVYVEHVITRPFAPAGERKVTRLDVPGLPAVPEDAHPFEEAEALVAGHDLVAVREHRFGLMHTDSNQHVNALVYPRLFEECVVERSPDPLILAHAMEVRYRKPFFGGERATVALALAGANAVGAFLPPTSTKPSSTIAMWLG